jgi:hypothetical protein
LSIENRHAQINLFRRSQTGPPVRGRSTSILAGVPINLQLSTYNPIR